MGFLPPPPQDGAYASSATEALCVIIAQCLGAYKIACLLVVSVSWFAGIVWLAWGVALAPNCDWFPCVKQERVRAMLVECMMFFERISLPLQAKKTWTRRY